MKKRYILTFLIIIFGLLFWALTKGISNAPVNNNPNTSLEPDKSPAQKEGKIIVTSPLIEEAVSSPISIKGRAVGNWFFEASAPVDVVNWDGLIIGQGYVTVDEGYNWMTTDMVPFSGVVSYDASQLGPYNYGWIIMKKDNPSSEPQFDDALEFKVFFQ
ncbi:hypothetical protein IT402_00355 [Candidatus Nomurabacteria bacterium]|nr:hypothetical protein [Candidatus Nomurabacteria bacterium]